MPPQEDKMFEVIWSCRKQNYTIYKDGKYLITTYDGVAAKSYLDNGGKIKVNN